MERNDKEKCATLEASVSSRTVDLGMEIQCALCELDSGTKATLLVGYHMDVPAIGILPAKTMVVFSPMCYECYIIHQGRMKESPAVEIPLIHLGYEPETTEANLSGIRQILRLALECVKDGNPESGVHTIYHSLGFSPELSTVIVEVIQSALNQSEGEE